MHACYRREYRFLETRSNTFFPFAPFRGFWSGRGAIRMLIEKRQCRGTIIKMATNTHRPHRRHSDPACCALDWRTARTSGTGCRISCKKTRLRGAIDFPFDRALLPAQRRQTHSIDTRKDYRACSATVALSCSRASRKRKEPLTATRYYVRAIRVYDWAVKVLKLTARRAERPIVFSLF